MDSDTVIEDFDLFLDRRSGLLPSMEATVVDHFLFQCSTEVLGRGVVVTVAFARHRGVHSAL